MKKTVQREDKDAGREGGQEMGGGWCQYAVIRLFLNRNQPNNHWVMFCIFLYSLLTRDTHASDNRIPPFLGNSRPCDCSRSWRSRDFTFFCMANVSPAKGLCHRVSSLAQDAKAHTHTSKPQESENEVLAMQTRRRRRSHVVWLLIHFLSHFLCVYSTEVVLLLTYSSCMLQTVHFMILAANWTQWPKVPYFPQKYIHYICIPKQLWLTLTPSKPPVLGAHFSFLILCSRLC